MNEQPTSISLPFCAPPMDEVRWAFIGVGGRGTGHLHTITQLKNARVTAISDTHAPNIESATEFVREKGGDAPYVTGENDDDWKRVLERDDVDAVVNSTVETNPL